MTSDEFFLEQKIQQRIDSEARERVELEQARLTQQAIEQRARINQHHIAESIEQEVKNLHRIILMKDVPTNIELAITGEETRERYYGWLLSMNIGPKTTYTVPCVVGHIAGWKLEEKAVTRFKTGAWHDEHTGTYTTESYGGIALTKDGDLVEYVRKPEDSVRGTLSAIDFNDLVPFSLNLATLSNLSVPQEWEDRIAGWGATILS